MKTPPSLGVADVAPQDFTTPWHPHRYTVDREYGPTRWAVWDDLTDVEVAAFATFTEAQAFARECRDRHPHTDFFEPGGTP